MRLDEVDAEENDTLRTLAAVVVEAARPDRAEAMAELELGTLAARDDRFRAELDRYNNRRIWRLAPLDAVVAGAQVSRHHIPRVSPRRPAAECSRRVLSQIWSQAAGSRLLLLGPASATRWIPAESRRRGRSAAGAR